jgi:DNA-binding transcriptional ArsR family regulator
MAKSPLSILPEKELSLPEKDLHRRNDDSVPAMLADLNRMVHEPARLAILTVLSTCALADFKYLQTATGLSKGNLSVQLSRLEQAGLTASQRVIERKHTLTTVTLTDTGRFELARYWDQIERIRAHSTQRVT